MLVTLTAPVGFGKTNAKTDVMNVQLLLNKFIVPGRLALPVLVVDGDCGKKTRAAIKAFQGFFLGWKDPDGGVSPGKPTLAALNGSINQPQLGDPSETTRQTVIKTLKSVVIKPFVMDGKPMSSADLHQVADAVSLRQIEVVYAPGLNDNAEYHHNTNAMYLGFQTAASAFLKSVVVHEATHAVLDQRGRPQTVLQAEALAFIAQCVYYRQLRGSHIHEVSYGPSATVLMLAGNIAIDVFAGKGVTYSALKALYEAIPKVPTYAQPYSIYNYNGLA